MEAPSPWLNWNRKELQSCSAFQRSTGRNTSDATPVPRHRAPACEKRPRSDRDASRPTSNPSGSRMPVYFEVMRAAGDSARHDPPAKGRLRAYAATTAERHRPERQRREERGAAHRASRARKHRTSPAGPRTRAPPHRLQSGTPGRERPHHGPAGDETRQAPGAGARRAACRPAGAVPVRMNQAMAGG